MLHKDDHRLGKHLATLRQERGWSLRRASHECDGAIGHVTVSNVEKMPLDEINPTLATLKALSVVYNTPLTLKLGNWELKL